MFKMNKVIKILIFSDTLFLSSFGFINPIFALFLTNQIKDGTIQLVGYAAALFLASKTIFLLPISRFIDKLEGQKDDLFCLVFGSMLMTLVCFLYIFSRSAYHIYFLQIMLGLGAAFYSPGWYVLFTRHIDRYREGMTWGVYEVIIGLTGALVAPVGAFIADKFGFRSLFMIVGTVAFIGSLLPILIYKSLKTAKEVKEKEKLPPYADHKKEVL